MSARAAPLTLQQAYETLRSLAAVRDVQPSLSRSAGAGDDEPSTTPFLDAGGILVVEDDADIREVLVECLQEDGHLVQSASNGWEALGRVALQRPRLILLDLMLPRMNGWQFVAEARARFPVRLPPIVLLSAVPNLAREAERLRAQAYVRKPFDLEEILGTVRRCLAGLVEN